jgi:hypothetical protein
MPGTTADDTPAETALANITFSAHGPPDPFLRQQKFIALSPWEGYLQ